MIHVLIIEDEVMIAEDLAETCRSYGYHVIEPAYAPGDALNKLKSEKVDLVLLDINLESNINGIEIASFINDQLQLPFIYLSSYSDPRTLTEARNTKPMAYITKPFKRADIYTTIEIALQNWGLLNSKGFPTVTDINSCLLTKITSREYELLKEIHQGKSNQQVAEKLHISLNTVKSHLKNVYSKLEVDSRVAALSKIRQML
jgi:DNA-binding NarL/FixJ family response regulator